MFRFKQFVVQQDKCAMKVGTDGVLLGAWANCEFAKTILDVGTGTGLVALMLAQRNQTANISAVEIDQEATKQAHENFENSPWVNRLSVYNASIQDFARQKKKQFDFIVSNPPFFESTYEQIDVNRKNARQEHTLTLSELFSSVNLLLSNEGIFTLVYPSERESEFMKIAVQNQFYLKRKRYVQGTNHSPIKRILIELSKTECTNPIIEPILIIEPEKRHQYSTEYKQLTKDFYLKF